MRKEVGMTMFNIGDYVERIGPTVSDHMRFGRILRVISHKDSPGHLTAYAVDFGFVVATCRQDQLRAVNETESNTG